MLDTNLADAAAVVNHHLLTSDLAKSGAEGSGQLVKGALQLSEACHIQRTQTVHRRSKDGLDVSEGWHQRAKVGTGSNQSAGDLIHSIH